MSRSLSEAANYVLSEFDALGINVSPSSRIKLMCKAVCNKDGTSRNFISESDAAFTAAIEALRDILLIAFFFDQARKDDANRTIYCDLVKKMINDPVLAQKSKGNTVGRDAQAEAFVFAVCRNAGMEGVSLAEPDVTCLIDGTRFGIAVKRIKDFKQFIKRIKEGADQVQKSCFPGIVSIDICMAMNPNNYRIVSTGDERKLQAWWKTNIYQVVDQHHDSLQAAIRGKGVLCVLLHEHCPVKLNGEWVLRTMNYSVVDPDHREKIEAAGRFVGRFLQGLPNLVRQ